MRLIDADNIKKKIASVAILSLFDRTEISPEKLDSLIKMIDMEETAYDVDKVEEQIEKIMDDESIRFVEQSVNRAVKIVKNGGR